MVRKWALCGALIALVVATLGCRVPVSPTATNGWTFLNEGANGTGHYTNGPGTPPSGKGSALLTVDGTGREAVATPIYRGDLLSSFNHLQYSTYQAFSGSPQETPTLEFDMDYDSTDSSTAYQGRLVFVPGATGSVVPNTWQTWDTLTGSPGGKWYSSASDGSPYTPIVNDAPQAAVCTQASYCTWSQVLTAYPNARIRPSVGLFLLRAGGPIAGGFSGAVDNIVVNNINWDFEASDGNVTVTAAKAAGFDFGFSSETPSGTGSFVTGPTGSDGTGSARLTTDLTTVGGGSEALSTGVFAGTAVNRFSTLTYKTYVQSGANAPTLQLDADYDSTDASTAFQGRIVFEPSLSGGAAVTPQTWQTWDAINATSGWWQTGNPIVSNVTGTKVCTQGSPCSLATLEGDYPNLSVRPITGQAAGNAIDGRLWLKAGSNWGVFDGNVDTLTVGLDNTAPTTVYDLEP